MSNQEPALITTRTVTRDECPWLSEEVPKGTTVYEFWGCTYGCISPTGVAVSMKRGETPFLELPYDALTGADK